VLTGADHYLGGIYGRPELPGPKSETAFVELKAAASAFLLRYGAGQTKRGRLLDTMVNDKKLLRR
jgi:hypothetical protein